MDINTTASHLWNKSHSSAKKDQGYFYHLLPIIWISWYLPHKHWLKPNHKIIDHIKQHFMTSHLTCVTNGIQDFVKCCIKRRVHLVLLPGNILFGGLQPIMKIIFIKRPVEYIYHYFYVVLYSKTFIETIVSTVQLHIMYIPWNKNVIYISLQIQCTLFEKKQKKTKNPVFKAYIVYWLCMFSSSWSMAISSILVL